MLCRLYLDPVSLKASKQNVKTGWRTMFVISSNDRRLLLLDPFTLTNTRVFKIILSKGKIVKDNKTVVNYLTKTCNECIRLKNNNKKWPRTILTRLVLQLLEKEVVNIEQAKSFIHDLQLGISIRRFETMARKKVEELEENDFTDVEDVFETSENEGESSDVEDGEGKPEKVKKPRRVNLKFPKDGVITLNVTENPKRAGSKAHAAFSQYRTGMTVEEFLAAGGTTGDLNWDSARNFISVSGVEVPEPVGENTEDGAVDADETSVDTADESVAL
jgi:hypothetical protein